MTSWIIRALFALFVLAPAFAAEPPIVVGAVVSQSGMLADLADGYRKGLLVWQDEVNAAGGVRGRNVELRLLDDGSTAARWTTMSFRWSKPSMRRPMRGSRSASRATRRTW